MLDTGARLARLLAGAHVAPTALDYCPERLYAPHACHEKTVAPLHQHVLIHSVQGADNGSVAVAWGR